MVTSRVVLAILGGVGGFLGGGWLAEQMVTQGWGMDYWNDFFCRTTTPGGPGSRFSTTVCDAPSWFVLLAGISAGSILAAVAWRNA